MKPFRTILTSLALLAFLAGTAGAQIISGQNEPNPINLLDNGAMNVFQRGASAGSITTVPKYAQDRWAGWSGTSTIQTLSNVTTSLPAQFTNAAQLQRTSGQTGVVLSCIVQEILTSNFTPIAGQPVTLSFWASAGANFSAASSNMTVQIQTGTTADEGLATALTGLTGSALPMNSLVPITTGWQRYAVTATIPSTAIEGVVQLCWKPVGTAGTSDLIQVTGVQLQRGTVATNFEFKPYANELRTAQVYYTQWNDAPAATFTLPGTCTEVTSGTLAHCVLMLPATMRVIPTAAVTTATSFGMTSVAAGAAGACSTLAVIASANSLNSLKLSCALSETAAVGTMHIMLYAATGAANLLTASADF